MCHFIKDKKNADLVTRVRSQRLSPAGESSNFSIRQGESFQFPWQASLAAFCLAAMLECRGTSGIFGSGYQVSAALNDNSTPTLLFHVDDAVQLSKSI